MLRKIAMKELDVALEDGGVAGGAAMEVMVVAGEAAMEVMVVAGEGGGIAEVNAAEGELTTTSQALKMNT